MNKITTPTHVITQARSHRTRKHNVFAQRRKRLRQTYKNEYRTNPNKKVTVQELRVLENRIRILEELVDELAERVE